MDLVNPPARVPKLRRKGDCTALTYRQYNESVHGYTTPV